MRDWVRHSQGWYWGVVCKTKEEEERKKKKGKKKKKRVGKKKKTFSLANLGRVQAPLTTTVKD